MDRFIVCELRVDVGVRLFNGNICGTLRTITKGGDKHIIDLATNTVRGITPIECGKLQGFHMDNWKQTVTDAQAYKQFGNAVTVNVAREIGTQLISFLNTNLCKG